MKLTRVNTLLVLLIVAINLYVITAPMIPAITYWWRNRDSDRKQQLITKVESKPSIQTNALVVPSMLLDEPIFDGPEKDTYKILDKGIYRWPTSSTPDKGSNTVLLGHRFTYTDPEGVFYHLDKIVAGDRIGVTWEKKKYIYTVADTKIVSSNAVEILNPTEKPTLTIYTCTPIWSATERLVVTATLERAL